MRLLLPLLLLLLSACSSTPERPLPDDNQRAWEQRQQRLAQLQHWDLTGRLAILTDHEGWHVSIDWQQRAERYAIMLAAPMSQGALKLDGDNRQVTLQSDQGSSISANDPEALLAQQYGWRVPVSALRYWVRGLPAPGAHQAELDRHGRLTRLAQQGWEIELRDYTEHQGHELPGRVFASNHQGKVKLVIRRWQLLEGS
ncbi:MAG: lipoprotein insertase outer membrane protein LolB [Pseudomonadota bacterium]